MQITAERFVNEIHLKYTRLSQKSRFHRNNIRCGQSHEYFLTLLINTPLAHRQHSRKNQVSLTKFTDDT